LKSNATPETLRPVIGTLINVAGVIAGGIAGGVTRRNLSPESQQQARLVMTALTVLIAASLVWKGLQPPWHQALKQITIAALALSLGSFLGHALGLQRQLNRLLRWAAGSDTPVQNATHTFAVQALVFAANPLGWIGACLDGAAGAWQPLALKAALDGLAALGFAAAGSRTIVLAAVPMAALQGTLTLLSGATMAHLAQPNLIHSLQIEGGFLVLVMAPVLFGWRQVPLANYFPALLLAPVLTALWR
jgi:hypothetical protein